MYAVLRVVALVAAAASIASCSGSDQTEPPVVDRPVDEQLSNDDAAQTLLTNARVYSSASSAWVEAVAYDDAGLVIAIGAEDDVVGVTGEDLRIIDGRTHVVVPGQPSLPIDPSTHTAELTVGGPATFVVVDADPFTDPAETRAAMEVLLVVVDGREVSRSDSFDR